MNIIPHTEWEDPKMPVKGPVPTKSRITTIPAHYTAAAVVPGDTKLYLRSIQRDYTVNRHYSIGYNFAIDKTGQVWECRGLKIKCAANVKQNDITMAVLCLVDGSLPMNAKMVASFKELGAYIEQYFGRKMVVVGHRDIGATQCPGDGIYAQIRAGLLVPGTAPTPPKPPMSGDDMATAILQVAGRNAQLISTGTLLPDGSVHCVFAAWFGPGPDPANGIEGEFFNDHSSAPDTIIQATSPETLRRDIIFLGDLGEMSANDSAYDWSENDFQRVIP